jgi:SlyX protein
MAELEARVVELELRYTEQQALLEDLSGVVADQQKTIDRLIAELRLLKKKLEGEPGVTDSGPVERPPHY